MMKKLLIFLVLMFGLSGCSAKYLVDPKKCEKKGSMLVCKDVEKL